MTMFKKDDRPQHHESRFPIVTKGVGSSSDIWTSRKTIKRLLRHKFLMLDLLHHEHNAFINTAADGSIS